MMPRRHIIITITITIITTTIIIIIIIIIIMIINLNTIKKILIKIRKAYQQVGRREVAYLAVLVGDKVGLDAVEPRPPRVPQHHVVAHRAPACCYCLYHFFHDFAFCCKLFIDD